MKQTGQERFNIIKDEYSKQYKRVNNKDIVLSYQKGFVHVQIDSSLFSMKFRLSEFEVMTKRLTESPDYSPEKPQEEKVFETILKPEEVIKEDGGQAMVFTVSDPFQEENGLFVRIQSWDENKEHTEFKKFEGRKIRITIETIK